MSGFLEIILGPMFSGKTTYLINKYKEFVSEKKEVMVINYSEDKRYHDEMLSSHDKVMIPCIFTEKIRDLFNTDCIDNSECIFINEGQFFEDIFESVIYLVETLHKKVYVCGLDGDFKRNKFGRILDLIPFSDSIIKLRSRCGKCIHNDAIFTNRISLEKEQKVIGSSNYEPLCRNCYLESN